MSLLFKDLIRQASALAYIDDIFLMSTFKSQMLQLIKQLHAIAKKIPILAPKKSFSSFSL